ncbi:hypothetical protein DKX38_003948 [Salix brachista]|uniref:Uncharacterized protein n=1 Tax=Salix brachista TaxID=2182728 RepID=A0A5N5N910_9ROSI|nr:hypothetical protein DKX38_003948 [Salix brachista]
MREYQTWDTIHDITNPKPTDLPSNTSQSPLLDTPQTSIETYLPSPSTCPQTTAQINPAHKENHELRVYTRKKHLIKEIEHSIPPTLDQASEPRPQSAPTHTAPSIGKRQPSLPNALCLQ